MLLDRGADIEALDTTWTAPRGSGPSSAAACGSATTRTPDWPATVRTLLDADAATDGIVLSPDDAKPPSPEVAALLRARGIPEEANGMMGG